MAAVEVPKTGRTDHRVRPGEHVLITASETVDEWLHAKLSRKSPDPVTQARVSSDRGSLSLVMDRKATLAGDYYFLTDKQESGRVRVKLRRRSAVLGLAASRHITWIGSGILYAALTFFTLGLGEGEWPSILGEDEAQNKVRSYIFATATIAIALALVHWVSKRAPGEGRGLPGLFQGTDRRTSTSKTQLLLWTVGIAFALTYIGARSIIETDSYGTFECKNDNDDNCVDPNSWDT